MTETAVATRHRNELLARPAGFMRDLSSVAGRSLRQVRRTPENLVQPVVISLFFFVIFVAALEGVARAGGMTDFRAFQLPVATIFAVTGVTRAPALVSDITSGYFDRMLVTPTNRLAMLLGLMISDLVVAVLLTFPVLLLGFATGVRFVTGPLGLVAFVLTAALWGLVYAGFSYAIALRTGNATVVAQSTMLFFPFVFLTSSLMPQDQLSGWLSAVATVNPVTYMLEALRSYVSGGWDAGATLRGLGAIVVVGLVAIPLALAALRGRTSRS
ncbi:ABC transporter permease [Nonomuraea sp. NPDC048826]|uniref:ABC transporter permease n=1 Tax=Nonomuraea sp. NPDC048826 TaxID=3364347 RepID=UPI0037228AC5